MIHPRAAVLAALLVALGVDAALAQSRLDRLLESAPPASQPDPGVGGGRPDEPPAAASQPAVRAQGAAGRPDAIPGSIELSDGRTLQGLVHTTRNADLRVFVPQRGEWVDLPLASIHEIEAVVVWERMDDDWRFAESGNDTKVLTGHRYPARMTRHRFRLIDGRQVEGDVSAPLWLTMPDGERERHLLQQRSKGPLDSTLESLVYVRMVRLGAVGGEPRPDLPADP